MNPQTSRSGTPTAADTASTPHTVVEDAYAMIVGIIFVATGIYLLRAAGLVTGGIAGIALLLSYVLPLSVGTIFTLVNIPFFIFAWVTMGKGFAVKSMVASFGVTLLLAFLPEAMGVTYVNPLFAAIAGGTLCGMGVLALARHRAGVGGTGIFTLWLQRERGINAGYSQMSIDCLILLSSLLVISLDRVAWSVASALAISGMVIAWHRPGRYTGG
jgi:uncharacterized membrane-anchored protein YitT (DUF2179 family)